jgi:uncharacterized membrane protein
MLMGHSLDQALELETVSCTSDAPSAPPVVEPARVDKPPRSKERIASIDILRGAVMVLMALDHTRDYFHAYSQRFGPMDLHHTTPAIFFTRWITHFCAPVFVFLAGLSVFLAFQKMGDKARMARFLLVRGLILVLLEMTVVRFGWDFTLHPYFYAQIIWTIGWCMVLMAGVVALGQGWKGLFASAMLIAAILYANPQIAVFERLGLPRALTVVFCTRGTVSFGRTAFVEFAYPILRWALVMLAGYGFGIVLNSIKNTSKRRPTIFAVGASVTAAFLALRWLNIGDTAWSHRGNAVTTVLDFLSCTKLPASLPYMLMTLGPALCVLALLEIAKGPIARVLLTFGRVPLFFYVLHLYVIHGTAVVVAALRGQDFHMALPCTFFFPPKNAGFGFGLTGTYVALAFVLLVTYFPCRYFGELKHTRKSAWLRYF